MTLPLGDPLPLAVAPAWPARAAIDQDQQVVYAPEPVHLDWCQGGCGRRCPCPCHEEPKPRRAA